MRSPGNSTLVGPAGAQAIHGMLEGAQEKVTGVVATAIGLVTMVRRGNHHPGRAAGRPRPHLAGAAPPRQRHPDHAARACAVVRPHPRHRLPVVDLTGRERRDRRVPGVSRVLLSGDRAVLLQAWDYAFSVAAVTILFAMLYKWLPNVSIAWGDVWSGAFTTAVLFSAGRVAIGVYLGHSAMASAYGAAGTLIVLLLWLYLLGPGPAARRRIPPAFTRSFGRELGTWRWTPAGL